MQMLTGRRPIYDHIRNFEDELKNQKKKTARLDNVQGWVIYIRLETDRRECRRGSGRP